ncbi:MAG: 30S ribosomal protein S8 [Halobacteriales archaeon]
MVSQNTLSNALSGINNAEASGKLEHEIAPASTEIRAVLDVLEDRGYIAGYESIDDGRGGRLVVELTGSINECGPIEPRYATDHDGFERWEKRFLPARDFGSLLVTTSRGVMSHYDARDAGVGGQLIGYVY